MQQRRPPFISFKQQAWCAEAAQQDPHAAAFLLDERIPLDDRFEFATRILCPAESVRLTVH
jgi:hypothetical protein